jgi:hypothetical protein
VVIDVHCRFLPSQDSPIVLLLDKHLYNTNLLDTRNNNREQYPKSKGKRCYSRHGLVKLNPQMKKEIVSSHSSMVKGNIDLMYMENGNYIECSNGASRVPRNKLNLHIHFSKDVCALGSKTCT